MTAPSVPTDEAGQSLADGDFNWGTLIGAGAICALLTIPAYLLLSAIDSLGTFGAVGLLLGVWGLLISSAGFSVTWWQLAKTRGAAQASQRAINNLKREFRSFDVITELRTAKAAAEETRSHIDALRWTDAFHSYDRARVSLTKMVSVRDGLSTNDVDLARDYIISCVDGSQSVKKLSEDESAEVSKEILYDRLTSLDGFLISIEYSMKDAFHGRQ